MVEEGEVEACGPFEEKAVLRNYTCASVGTVANVFRWPNFRGIDIVYVCVLCLTYVERTYTLDSPFTRRNEEE
jgi:hypothetical protein